MKILSIRQNVKESDVITEIIRLMGYTIINEENRRAFL